MVTSYNLLFSSTRSYSSFTTNIQVPHCPTAPEIGDTMNAYNLMSVLCIFCYLERVCTVGCTVVERGKEAASFVTGDPA